MNMVLYKNFWLFIFLSGYLNFAQTSNLNRNKSSETGVKFHRLQNERLDKVLSSLRYGKALHKIKFAKRQAAPVVNENFDVLPYNYDNENSSEINVQEEDGSGIDAFDENETELYSTIMDYDQQQTTSSTKSSTQPRTNATEEVLKTTAQMSTMFDSDGSGDGITQLTTEDATIGTTSNNSSTPGNVWQETIPDICINSTCDTDELFVSISEESNIIAEGTNFTISCTSNDSNHMLYWYKSNGSVHFLQAFSNEKQLHLTLTDTKPIHSGKYICVHWVNKENCCSLQSDVTVYEVPLYKYHLIILGLIVVACLIICIVLSVRQSKTMKSYTKQFVEKHGSVKKQLL